ncbi:hypothetical protein CDL15_Pgr029203 [Punica granatum]|uniref:Uncharacterized protein n=1 Tax=Punica granatum TaxID=22663 RepID=A0A218XES9_PUNGR|nr:hypothetical protein CDL15_Pgr029203 [Punica granatum]PKI46459.1 hypothetical protein CRG98_033157 [Punica granatum]
MSPDLLFQSISRKSFRGFPFCAFGFSFKASDLERERKMRGSQPPRSKGEGEENVRKGLGSRVKMVVDMDGDTGDDGSGAKMELEKEKLMKDGL